MKSRGTWRMYVDRIDSAGARKRITKSSGVKCKDAGASGRREAMRMQVEWRSGLVNTAQVDSGSTLYEYCEQYLQTRDVKASTMKGYRTALRRIEGTRLGATRLCDIDQRAIREWIDDMRREGLYETTLSHYHAFLNMVLLSAVDDGDLTRSPIKRRSAPKARRRPINSLTFEERRRVLGLLDQMGETPFATAIRIALLTGARRGEICALRWKDVDLDLRQICIRHALTSDHGYKLSEPKNTGRAADKSRLIPIGDVLCGHLKARQAEQKAACEEFCCDWTVGAYVCGDPILGKYYSPDLLTRDWATFTRSNSIVGTQGKHPVLHDLRHTFATLNVASDMDIMTLASILGHVDAALTLNIYSDALASSKRQAMDEMDKTL